ncbi:MAG: hypothetical protein ABWX73_03765 [Marmoricola sp.]
METQQDRPRPSRRVWAQDVNVAADVLETRLDAAKAAHEDWTAAQAALETGVRRRLDAARNATLRRDPVPSGPGNWWRGTLVEAAYQNLHAAEALIVWLYTPDEVGAEIPEAVARVEAGLDRDDPRRVAALELFDARATHTARRARLVKAVEIGFSASDAEYARMRNFRNTVLGGAGAMTVLLVLFVGFVALNPTDVPFCFAPDPGSMVCASGGSAPSSHDVITVTLLGSLGGLLAAIIAIKNMRGTASPYNVPQALALLKLPLGAVSAMGALIAIRGDFVPGFSDLDSQPQILAYAFAFGVAQQLLTGVVDRQARAILKASPGKATTTTRPERAPRPQPEPGVPAEEPALA